MPIRKTRIPTYNDGILWVCEPASGASDFGAARNPVRMADLRRIQKLDFEERSKRDRDMDFAESQGRTLTVKVKCRLWGGLTKEHQILIGSVLYAIIHIDWDRKGDCMYIYLEEERTVT